MHAGKASPRGDLAEGHFGVDQQFTYTLQTASADFLAGCVAHDLFEAMIEPFARERHFGQQFLHANAGGGPVMNDLQGGDNDGIFKSQDVAGFSHVQASGGEQERFFGGGLLLVHQAIEECGGFTAHSSKSWAMLDRGTGASSHTARKLSTPKMATSPGTAMDSSSQAPRSVREIKSAAHITAVPLGNSFSHFRSIFRARIFEAYSKSARPRCRRANGGGDRRRAGFR